MLIDVLTSFPPVSEPNLINNNVGMVQLVDIFSKPECALMAGVMDLFLQHGERDMTTLRLIN